MSCQDILAMRKLITQKYDEYEPHLNPFCKMLFCQNWEWPSFYVLQNTQGKTKISPSKTSLKTEICSWQEFSFSIVRCYFFKNFCDYVGFYLLALPKNMLQLPLRTLNTYRKWDQSRLYHIYQRRSIPNYISKTFENNSFLRIMQCLRIAWLDQPVLYFQMQSEESQALFLELINWMNEASSMKVFEYAHKIKNKDDPQQNLLWFTQQSFQQLQSWLVNQFEKIIIRSYFGRNSLQSDIYSKIVRLKQGVSKKQNSNKKDIQKLLNMSIEDAILNNAQDYDAYQAKVKIYEDQYFQQAALLMDYEGSNQEKLEEEKKKKKKKNKKKNKKNKKEQISSKQILDDVNDDNLSQIDKQPFNQQNVDKVMDQPQDSEQILKNQINDQVYLQQKRPDQQLTPQEIEIKIPNEQKIAQEQAKKSENENLDKVSIFQELESQKSVFSSQYSTKKIITNSKNKSGKSHPEFYNSLSQSLSIEQNRSLSPGLTNGTQTGGRGINFPKKNSKKKQYKIVPHKRQKQKRNSSKHLISVQKVKNNSDAVIKENNFSKNSGSSEIEESSENYYVYLEQTTKSRELISEQNNQAINGNQQLSQNVNEKCNKKKRKKNNKTTNLLKELTKKIMNGLVTRQLNNFVDTLSTQTNNLYEHKRVAFERVRFFIQSIFPTTQTVLFGSNAVGLSLPTSDIDIMLFNLPATTKQQASQVLAHLAIQINTMNWIVSCSAYLNAKVPLVKLEIDPSINYMMTKRKCDYLMNPMIDPRLLEHLQLKSNKKQHINKSNNHYKHHQGYQHHYAHNYHSAQHHVPYNYYEKEEDHQNHVHSHPHNNKIIKVDLSVNLNDQGNLGAQSTELMKKWMAEYPQIHRAVLAFKYILAYRGFSSNFKGGIGSYCLFVMVAAYVKEFKHAQELDDGQFFMAILKFYGEEFENQIKSIYINSPNPYSSEQLEKQYQNSRKTSCFITLEESYNILLTQSSSNHSNQSGNYMHNFCQSEQISLGWQQQLHNIKDNPLRIFDPINNRIMSGSCQMFPQIKSEFRRIYKQLKDSQLNVQKQVESTINGVTQVTKMLENKKYIDKWLNKYQMRSGFDIKRIFEGDF